MIPPFDDTPVYHPKLYLLSGRGNTIIALGSSNLTRGGLKNNVEVNVVITAYRNEEIVSDVYDLYSRLKFQTNRFEPDLDYIDKYEEAYKRVQRKNADALRERSTREIIRQLKQKEKPLPKPTPTKSELFGWTRLVYEKLPSDTFRTNSIYKYEKEFQNIYIPKIKTLGQRYDNSYNF